MMYHCYADVTAQWLLHWQRRLAREQRAGTWRIAFHDPSLAALFRCATAQLHPRCAISIETTHAEITTCEFLPL